MEPAAALEHPKFLTICRKPLGAAVALLCVSAWAADAQRDRITKPVDDLQRFTLTGHLRPEATPANDRGPVDPTLKLSYVTLNFSQTPAQKADLAQLLADQQNPKSANYHRWLTPEQYAGRFGLSQGDLNAVKAWLQGEGLTIVNTARGGDWVAVSGAAAQIENAFQTKIHRYQVNGVAHFANAVEPSVPAAIGSVVMSIRGLTDFRMKPRSVKAHYNSASVCGGNCLGPADLAAIYDITPVYNAGIDGSGIKMAVAGQTNVYPSDIQQFRSTFGLTPNLPAMLLVPGSSNPGYLVDSGDLSEADLDLEWTGAVAPKASITYVFANDVMDAIQYAIDENIAPVVSSSYGGCEQETESSQLSAFQSWAQKGNAFGITWFNASGDYGAADCDDNRNPGLTVDAPGSIPEVTDVGGTEFNEGGAGYWSSTANPATGLSALGYIPEIAWNDSAADSEPSASGGGVSVFFAKPSWQTGPGVPANNFRNVPDVSLNASADHDPYVVYTPPSSQGCSTEECAFGGTSASAQVFAGIAALLNQYVVATGKQSAPGLGNLNAQLYSLAKTSSLPSAGGPTRAIFHDITIGNNIVTAQCGSGRFSNNANCVPVGYNAGPNFDQVTGLGSVDVWNLLTGFNGGGAVIVPPPSTVTITLTSNLTSMATSDVAFLIATATNSTGVTPTGDVYFTAGSIQLGSAALVGSNGIATATLPVSGSQIGLATTNSQMVTATYDGNSSDSITASVTFSARAVSAANSTPSISGITNAGSYAQTYAPGEIVAIFGSNLASSTDSASTVPFPLTTAGVSATLNGEAMPLWYVSPTQMNLQIPYEAPVGSEVILEINNNGKVVSQTMLVAPAAPGIFTLPGTTDIANGLPAPHAGTETTLYLTGIGAVNPSIATGAAPAADTLLTNLPVPVQNVTVTVNGVPTSVEFDGIIWGLVGVAQINFIVPSGTPAGTVPVVVKIGSASATANLIVAN